MSYPDLINFLEVIALVGLIIALVYLILVLYRANKILSKFTDLSDNLSKLISDVLPAIINIGTIGAAVETILHLLHRDAQQKAKTNKKED